MPNTTVPNDAAAFVTPEDLEARLLYRDALALVIDKPAGLAVHAGGKGGEHLGLYLDALRFGLPRPPELAHRLDRETSGCLALGRNRHGLRRLGELFAGRQAEKVYWAVVVGAPPDERGVIDKPLAKIDAKFGWKMKVDPKGQPSQTEWRVLGRNERLVWLECRPLTGRTHQIRVHLASLGLPVVGDCVYGKGTADQISDKLHLHARSLLLPLYPKKPAIAAIAPAPEHMKTALSACGWNAG